MSYSNCGYEGTQRDKLADRPVPPWLCVCLYVTVPCDTYIGSPLTTDTYDINRIYVEHCCVSVVSIWAVSSDRAGRDTHTTTVVDDTTGSGFSSGSIERFLGLFTQLATYQTAILSPGKWGQRLDVPNR